MNKNTLVSDRLNELYKKYFQSTDYKVGDSFESVKENMSAEDYDTSQKLLNYYSQQNSLADQYNYSNKVVEQERNKALQENSIAKEKTMKYLPEYLSEANAKVPPNLKIHSPAFIFSPANRPLPFIFECFTYKRLKYLTLISNMQ